MAPTATSVPILAMERSAAAQRPGGSWRDATAASDFAVVVGESEAAYGG
ncbi:hypothetical protein SNL152K_8565 [Streptomyces sp. NL15-2K]|nr:hypothetical protein SNL152K_8565 [Streptomyces sp. NL15-2K]